MDIKKKYNHLAIETTYKNNRYFEKAFATKKNTKREKVITQMPISIDQESSIHEMSWLIKESVIGTYNNMIGKKTIIIPTFDTEEKNTWLQQFKKILTKTGIFFDIDTDNIIYSERNTNFIRNIFVELAQRWAIYEDVSINYRSIKEQKTLSKEEILRKKASIKQYNIRYFVDTKNISLIVPTTDPESIFADVALAVHPEDKRYKKLINNKVIIPIVNKSIPIIGDESVNPIEWTGIIRVTPWHDELWLKIAQKHNLPTHVFAIDKKGYFTKQAGDFYKKEAQEFIKNILKNLDDIHNLESTNYKEKEVLVHKKTGEKVWPMLCNQLFLKTDTQIQKTKESIENNRLTLDQEETKEEITTTLEHFTDQPITKEGTKWYPIPCRKSKKNISYFFSDTTIINLPNKKTKNKKTVLSLIIFNLIADMRLRQHFSIEECIDVLIGTNRTWETTTIESYIELFTETLPRWYTKEIHEIQKLIEHSKQEKNSEKFSIGLIEMLEKSVAISNKKKWFYSFDMDTLTNNDEWLVQKKEKIEETLVYGCMLIKILESFDNGKKTPQKTYVIERNKLYEWIKTILLRHKENEPGFDSLSTYSRGDTKKRNKESIKSMIQTYGIDSTRLYAIDPNTPPETHTYFLTKLWNVWRLLSQKKEKKAPDFDQMSKYIKKHIWELHEFELRILYKTKELQNEYEEAMKKNNISNIQKKLIQTIQKDFCEKYIEIDKHEHSIHINIVAVRVFWNILKLLHPYTPFITQEIRKILWFEWNIYTQWIQENPLAIEKSYKTQLFVDIIDKFLELKEAQWYAKHEKINICFFAPLDFLQYIKKQEKTLDTLINISSIHYLENEKLLDNYYTANIINIHIWIPKTQTHASNTNEENLEELLYQKEQVLQKIRNILPWLSTSWCDEEIIQQKKQEMSNIKKDIEQLQYRISKKKLQK